MEEDGIIELSSGQCNSPAVVNKEKKKMTTLDLYGLQKIKFALENLTLKDTIVMGETFDKHLKSLEGILNHTGTCGLAFRAKKSTLFQKEVKYCWHCVTAAGISTDENKMKAVRDWLRPQNLHELSSFLELLIYYQRYVKKFVSVTSSLHKLTTKSRPKR